MGNTHEEYSSGAQIPEHHNRTHEDAGSSPVPSHWVLSIVTITLCCFIILENLLVLASVGRSERPRSATCIFLGNLALSDLLTGLVFLTGVLLSLSPSFNPKPLHRFVLQGTASAAWAASAFTLLAAAVERLVAVAKLRVGSFGMNSGITLGVNACWVAAAVIGGLPVTGRKCEFHDFSAVLPLCSKRYVLFVAAVLILVPLVSAGLCGRAYGVARSGNTGNGSARSSASLEMVAVALGAFVVLRLPALVILLADAACPAGACPALYEARYFSFFFFFLALFDSAVNPVIYALWSEDVRRELRRGR